MSEQDSPSRPARPLSSVETASLAASLASIEPCHQQAESAKRPSTSVSQSTSTPTFRLPKSPIDQPPAKAAKVVPSQPPAKAAKVAIPRLALRGNATPGVGAKPGGRHRVMHACQPCRSRKTKCSGERPACKHCLDFKVICAYADGKRDRAKKAFGSLAEKVADYEILLRDLASRLGEEDANLIRSLLEKDIVGNEDSPRTVGASIDTDGESGEESDISAGVGSTGAADRIREDFNRSEEARTTGFMGKNSEITWLQRLRQENQFGDLSQPDAKLEFSKKTGGAVPLFENTSPEGEVKKSLPDDFEGFSVNESSYHLDDFTVFVPDTIDRFGMPPREIADQLFKAYLDSVHPSFPIIGKTTFSSQYRRFIEGSASSPGLRWLAIMNMIFAIGAKYGHLIQAEWRGDERDHLIYFSRARLLSLNGNTIFNHADLQQVQVSGLIAFYLLSTSQINRAWMINGFALRAAIALGGNMRNESTRMPDTSKEIRYRVWWSIYSLEHQLSMMTGRPMSIASSACTTPLPAPMEEESFQSPQALSLLGSEMQKNARYPGRLSALNHSSSSTPASSDRSRSRSKPTSASKSPSTPTHVDNEWARNVPPNSSSYFLHQTQLIQIAQSILNALYAPEAMQSTWSNVQRVISDLDQRMEEWYSSLPTVFDFKQKQRDPHFLVHRMCLGFLYYSARIIIHRPCLCRLDRKMPAQSVKSRDFNRSSAASCVDSAREMLQMLPDEPNAGGLNRIGPWWCIVHYLVQANVVLLLELSFRAHHMPEEAENIFKSAQKAVRWLHSLGEENYSARRAWSLCNRMLRESAPKIGKEVDDLPTFPPGPLDEPWYDDGPTSVPNHPSSMGRPMPAQDASSSGANIDALPRDFTNMPVFSGWDEYLSYSDGERPASFFPTTDGMDFTVDMDADQPPQSEYADHYGAG